MIPGGPLILVVCAGALFAAGLAALISRTHLIKLVMGVEFLGKGVSLVFILGGYLAGDTGVSQAVVFTLIVIEAVVAGLALALVILLKRTWKTFDSASIARLVRGGDL
ncbi:MAG: NADH-quinone oxidoreductase subunit K [Methanoregula sp.]|uniref:NADH-quinone oxidoreductase subunit K n=1 Tax=Methanoregula sp. TaxID=2052170 RepID=UPI003D0ED30A